MGKHEKLLAAILSGRSDYNIAFHDLVALLVSRGFVLRSGKGSHAVLTKAGIPERIVLQPDGNKAKGYQVRQVRRILTSYPDIA
jgi:predicted RNA binding protein YcfA (HicA-like mRNA interferase family)